MPIRDHMRNIDESVKCKKEVKIFRKCQEKHPVSRFIGRCERQFMKVYHCLKEEVREQEMLAKEQETSNKNS